MNKPIANAMLRGIRAQGWYLVGVGGSVTQAIKPLETLMERQVTKAKKADEALLLRCLELIKCSGVKHPDLIAERDQLERDLRERLGEKE